MLFIDYVKKKNILYSFQVKIVNLRKIKKYVMRRLFVLMTLLLIVCVNAYSQIAPDRYWIQFTDKNNTPYSIDRPEEFLSERSIQRRVKYGISIDEKDLPVNPSYIKAVENAGATILNPSKWLNGVTIETNNNSVLDAIEKLPFVKKTCVMQDEPLKQMLKNESFISEMKPEAIVETNVSRGYYGSAHTQIELLNGVALHNMGYRGEGVWIGICDSGYQGADVHNAFKNMRDENRLLGTKDFVYKNGIVYSDDHHGTACLGLMAACIPNVYVGTAPKASYFLCRTENINSENIIEEYNWVSAAEYMDSLGIDMISTSLGYIGFDDSDASHDYEDFDGKTCIITIGAEIASSRGILCVAAAGNEGDNDFPYVGGPGDGKNVLTVGGVKSDGSRTAFSSIGPTYDGRIKPDVMSFAYAVTVASPNGDFYQGNGTSFAAPSLAGMLACYWQARKDVSESKIREIIKQSSNNYSSPNNEYGYGIPDFEKALDMLNLGNCDIFDEKTLFSVYPNPSNGVVKFALNFDVKITVQVFDILGKMIYISENHNGGMEELNVFLSNLDEGLYMIKAFGEKNIFTTKLVKY